MTDNSAKLLEYIQNPSANGWCQPDKAMHLYNAVRERKAMRAIEVGVFAGKSLMALGLAMQTLGRGEVIGIDPWTREASVINNEGENAKWWASVNYESIYEEAQHWVRHFQLGDLVTLFRETSQNAHYALYGDESETAIDVLHIDGNHSQWDSCRDVILWTPHVVSGGLIYLDDEDWETTTAAQELLSLRCEKIDEIKTTNVCGVYRKK